MATISVIVPVYKVEDYLSACIESILKQTFKNFELILVDDGSPDKCPLICDSYQKMDKRITVIHKSNGGLSSARNTGLDFVSNSSSTYITFIDSDDYVDPKYLELLYKRINETNSVVSACGIYTVNKDKIESLDKFSKEIVRGKDIFAGNNVNHYFSIVPAKLYLKSEILKYRFLVGYIHEDDYFSNEFYSKNYSISTIHDQLYFYRVNLNSTMHKRTSFSYICAIKAFLRRIFLFRIGKFAHTRKDILRFSNEIISLLNALCVCNDIKDYLSDYRSLLLKCFFSLPLNRESIKFRLFFWKMLKIGRQHGK